MAGRKLSDERSGAEERAAEVERKLSDLMSRIYSMIHIDVTDMPAAYSAEQTLNAVGSFALYYSVFVVKTSQFKTGYVP